MAEGDAGSDQRQNEEIEAMAAIYGEEWCVIDDCAKIFCIRISDDIDDPKWTLCLQVMLPNEYPGTAPPIYQLNAPWLKGQERADLSNSLEEIYIQNIGESILYLWVEKIRDVLIQKSQMTEPGPDVKKKTEEEDVECEDDLVLACQPENQVKTLDFDVSENRTEIEELPPIDHGIPITDRRSTFQAHLAPVVCPKQVKMVLAKLYENKKIASATHNIYAYRIYCEDKQTFLQDCEDDGETAAGGRLLHLMEILNVRDVMVVVSRWYGGVLLGPDRFKHINNCARNILVEKNYTNSPLPQLCLVASDLRPSTWWKAFERSHRRHNNRKHLPSMSTQEGAHCEAACFLLGNAVVILAFVVDKNLRHRSNYFFLNLAISDFFVGMISIPLFIPHKLFNWEFENNICVFWLTTDYLLCTASVYNIVLISFDRYQSVSNAVSYRARHTGTLKTVTLMVAVWVAAFLVHGPILVSEILR
ncbi:hypothetical protein E5288_WYG002922 [Bos mutus]|uniref:Protein IMPACT n=1 Tax=Bos mutus TaxID=72004 RepID=A0A6B0SBQ1_9CETA|nr:hypothetical protein [Bos mutus]